jgi:hypothetical protein
LDIWYRVAIFPRGFGTRDGIMDRNYEPDQLRKDNILLRISQVPATFIISSQDKLYFVERPGVSDSKLLRTVFDS